MHGKDNSQLLTRLSIKTCRSFGTPSTTILSHYRHNARNRLSLHEAFKSSYNKLMYFFKKFGFAKRDRMTGIFMYLSLPTADTIVYNARILSVNQCAVSCNRIVRWFADIDVKFFFFSDMDVYFFFSFYHFCVFYILSMDFCLK